MFQRPSGYQATTMDIATWAREYFGKSLSLNTACSCIQTWNLNLYYAKRKAFNNFAQNHRQVLWAKSTFQLVFQKKGRRIPRVKDEKDHPDCYQQKMQKPDSMMVWGWISAHSMGDLHICEGTIDVEAFVGILERHMLPSRRQFSQELHVYISRTMPGLILHELQQRGFVGKECVCLTGLPAVQICLLLKMYGSSWRGESDNADHRLLSSSSLVYMYNGQKFHLQNCALHGVSVKTEGNTHY